MKQGLLFLAAAALAAGGAPFLDRGAPQPPAEVEWPGEYEGRALTPMAPAAEDARLARDFPGRIARFSDGRRQIVLRSVAAATRQLHPAGDCFRALGYAIEPLPMMPSDSGALASCFRASRNGTSVKVCERIVDSRGESFSDASSWYWPALLGRSRGPWLAATTIERVAPEEFTGVKH